MKSNKLKSLFLFTLFLISTLSIIPTSNGQEIEIELLRQRIQYGYWEITPVIENILTDWTVAEGTWLAGYAEEGSGFATLSQEQAIARSYIIDPDSNQYTSWRNRSAKNIGTVGEQIFSNIYSSAPPVGFAIGQIYLSDWSGKHWSQVSSSSNEPLYDNFTQAIDNLAEWDTIINYEKNTTHIYREIPYSLKICFWTQGTADYTTETMSIPLLDYYHQDDFLGLWGQGDAYYVPEASYEGYFDYVKESYVDIEPVTANLNLKIIAPLWTQSATQIIETPDGQMTAVYDNTWIGFLDAKVTDINGGHIDPSIPPTPAGQAEGIVDGGTIAPPPDEPEIYSSGSTQQTITPAPSKAGLQDTTIQTDPSSQRETLPPSNSFPADQSYGDISDYGFPDISEGGLVEDPKFYESYFIAASQAMGASLGNVQGDYLVSWNDSYQSLGLIVDGVGSLQELEYAQAQANYINSTIIQEISDVDRQYSSDLALDREIPNSLDITLGATLKPALHTWFTDIEWVYKKFASEMVTLGGRHTNLKETATNVISVLSGQEVINVYISYTVTFTTVMIDRYDLERTPATNRWSSDDLNPYIKHQLHNNTYDGGRYEFQIEYFDLAGTSNWITIAVWGLAVGLWVFWIYRAYKKSRPPSRTSFFGELKSGIIKKLIITLAIVIVVPIVLGFFFGGFFGFLFGF